jgi:prepilin-type processing-associated H-X9-DG protein
MGIVFAMYTNESRAGMWPPVSAIPGNWIVDARSIYPEYMTDLNILVCPDSPFDTPGTFYIGDRPAPECVSSLFYTYTGFAIERDEEAVGLVQAYYTQPFETLLQGRLEITVPVWAEASGPPENTSWGQAGIPVMWDRIPLYDDEFAHEPAGANVLHMDGHVEFVRYSYYNPPTFFPVTRISAELFGSTMPRMPGECR